MRFLLLALATFLGFNAAAADIPPPPTINAASWVIMDYASGEVLASHNPDQRVEPASITKVLTTYIVFDEIRKGHLSYTDEVLVSEKAWRQGIDSSQSRMFIKVGDRVPVIDLLRGVIIASGNDASVALSEHVAGSEAVFADLMNQYAAQLGMNNSHFVDASGMPDPEHYTTARDLAIVGRALIRDFPEGYKIYSEKEFKYGPVAAQPNRNYLLKKDPTVDGIKTGHTNAAGYCLLASAQREGQRLITTVMGASSWAYREQASLELLNYGFRFYDSTSLLGADQPAGTLRIWKGDIEQLPVGTLQAVAVATPRDSQVSYDVQPAGAIVAPVKTGDIVGQIVISVDNQPTRTEPLVALQDVDTGGWIHQIVDQVMLWIE